MDFRRMNNPETLGGGKKIAETPRCAVDLSKIAIDMERLETELDSTSFTPEGMPAGLPRGALSAFYFDGHPVDSSSVEKIGRGSFGKVYQCRFVGGPTLAIKFQQWDSSAVDQLRIAERLVECDLIEFRAIRIKFVLITFMPKLDIVGSMTSFADKVVYQDAFVGFLREVNACLEAADASYGDMKCANIAFCPVDVGGVRTAKFRLIDLDGVDSNVATYPYTVSLKGDMAIEPKIAKRLQTLYASAVTALVYWKVGAPAAGPQHTRRERKYQETVSAMTRLFYREKLNKEPMGREYESFMDRIDMITGYLALPPKESPDFPGGRAVRAYICDTFERARQEAVKLARVSGSVFNESLRGAGSGAGPGAPAHLLPQKRVLSDPDRTLSLSDPGRTLSLSDPDRTLSPPAAKRKRLINWTEMVSEDSTF